MAVETGPKIHKDDVGTVFILRVLDENGVPVDVAGSTVEFRFKKPITGTVVSKIGVLETPTTDGKVSYTVLLADDLWSEAGAEWKAQCTVTFDVNNEFNSDIVEFTVHDNI